MFYKVCDDDGSDSAIFSRTFLTGLSQCILIIISTLSDLQPEPGSKGQPDAAINLPTFHRFCKVDPYSG